ncbi:Crp/Fnr family transcriptional regulator [Methylovulum psychrotolerans]|jgi:CRP/FNR family cyclic AMP-dependent transcriptional regulator|uniref:Crp/Fnr family transcriptional regulator n=1 Tax=Methylovulum psychrotolerans TaxID=1704499 RepID=A0A1Z4BTY9_9GAMM|nr:Crp/Fnr family transcriptional regulator [Methylovulum psychrotolerans]ASF44669.1 Crp/Fnr family transcriptional regulator [Methylovulum psychrotolerans]MBT9098788.1 Crp/Fnr family transcriptional regulator [Methylovulum psychrotolerans]POZ52632.1 Crp/Fnr family transcriptional regulator [Methylovulum psychrotolerans]
MQQDALLGLKKVAFLSLLPNEAIESLALKAKCCTFPKQTIIITEKDETDSLYIIISGKVKIFTSDNGGREVTLVTQETGSYFGELALLANEPRSASVITLEKTVCGVISKVDFTLWLTEHPDVTLNLLADLSEKVRQLTQKVKHLALSNVHERTVQVLYKLAVRDEHGNFFIQRRPTQQELASMVGASREMINKVLKDLSQKGHIEIHERTMILKIPF